MTDIRAAIAFAVAAWAVGWAAPAAAEPSAIGTYTFDAGDGENATWNLTPCAGDPPGCVRVSEVGNSKRGPWSGEAHFSVGSWILFVQQPDAILCADGTAVPGRNTYSWDNSTLSGNVSIFSDGACGAEPETLSIPFRLTKAGAAPAPPPVQAPPVQAPPAPLPAESSAGN